MRYKVLGPELRRYGKIAVIAVQRPDGTYVGGLSTPNELYANEVLPEARARLRKGAAKLIREDRHAS